MTRVGFFDALTHRPEVQEAVRLAIEFRKHCMEHGLERGMFAGVGVLTAAEAEARTIEIGEGEWVRPLEVRYAGPATLREDQIVDIPESEEA